MTTNAHFKFVPFRQPPSDGQSPMRSPASETASPTSVELSAMAMVECPSCETANLRTRKFCGTCGQPLREPCVECGAETLLGEAFCGECGVDLGEACQQQARLAEADFLQARQLWKQGEFGDARMLVEPWVACGQLALAEVARQAAELAEEIDKRSQNSTDEIDNLYKQAQKYLADCRWRAVVSSIEQIPTSLRLAVHDQMLAQAKDAVRELNTLGEDIRTSIQADRLAGLLPKVERALELNPADEKLISLARQLKQRSSRDAQLTARQRLDQAKQKLAAFDYVDACELLEDVPESGRDKDFETAYRNIRELAYLWSALRHTPVVDASLPVIAERLAKKSPNDQRVGTIIEQLRQRTEKQKARPLGNVAWARTPPETALGYPVRRLTTFGSINIDDIAGTPLFVENAPRLYVACGVALQGLQKSPIGTNLCPKPKSKFGRLGALFQGAPKADSAWGIDLSNSGLKAVRLVCDSQKNTVAIKQFDVLEHNTPLPALVNEAQRRDVVAETLRRFLDRNSTQGDVIGVAYPAAQVLSRFLSIPPTDAKQTDELMRYEARQQIPVPLDQLKWDYHVWQPSGSESELPRDAMLLASKLFHVSQRLQPFEDSGLRPIILQCDCIALYNFYRYTQMRAESQADDTWSVLCDIGAGGTNFLAWGNNRLWYRSLPHGGNDFTLALVRKAKMKFAQAEQLKLHPEKARRLSDLDDAWQPIYDKLLRDIRDSIEAFGKTHHAANIDRVSLCGGGMRLLGLHRHLVG